MNRMERMIKKYTFLYGMYLLLSLLLLAVMLSLFIYDYFTHFNDAVTIADLFLLVILLLLSLFFQIGALHYHKLLILLTINSRPQRIRKQMKKGGGSL